MEENLEEKLVSFEYPDGLKEAAEFCFPELSLEEAEARIFAMISFVLVR